MRRLTTNMLNEKKYFFDNRLETGIRNIVFFYFGFLNSNDIVTFLLTAFHTPYL